MSIRVLIVEDSASVRTLLEHIISADPRFDVVASVSSAEEAIRRVDEVQPDVISMDVCLPGMSGLEAVREIMHRRPTPTVVVSALAGPGEMKLTIDALRAGALVVVEKPGGPGHSRHAQLSARLLEQLALMSQVKVIRQRRFAAVRRAPPSVRRTQPRAESYAALGIVASTGGPGALEVLLGSLRPDWPTPILLVQHITDSFLDGFVSWLSGLGPFTARKAADGEPLRDGVIHVAPADHHLTVLRGRLRLAQSTPVSFQRPSGTVLFDSMASAFGARALGVVLTGMGEDGAAGLQRLRSRGGYTIAEDETTAVVFGMPGAAVRLDAARETLPLGEIGPRLNLLASHPVREERRS